MNRYLYLACTCVQDAATKRNKFNSTAQTKRARADEKATKEQNVDKQMEAFEAEIAAVEAGAPLVCSDVAPLSMSMRYTSLGLHAVYLADLLDMLNSQHAMAKSWDRLAGCHSSIGIMCAAQKTKVQHHAATCPLRASKPTGSA